MDYVVQKAEGIPKPLAVSRATNRPKKYPLHTMEIDEMFFVPGAKPATMVSLTSATGKRIDRKFETRKLYMVKDAKGKWVQVSKDAPGALLGVAVYRTK